MHLVTQMSHTSSGLCASPSEWMNERVCSGGRGVAGWLRCPATVPVAYNVIRKCQGHATLHANGVGALYTYNILIYFLKFSHKRLSRTACVVYSALFSVSVKELEARQIHGATEWPSPGG